VAPFAIPPSPTQAHATRVAVVADHGLIAEAVRAALLGRGYEVVVGRWPRLDDQPAAPKQQSRRRRRSLGPPPDVALMLSDLDRIELVRAAQSLLEGLNVPWLVLTGAARGPAWGALYERGANLVESSHVRLDATCELLEGLAQGRLAQPGGRRRRELIQQWHAFARQRGELTARLETLTDREEEVLHQLHAGMTVRAIAQTDDVTESTVRSQVKAILRKLHLSSQIAAVAAYESIHADSTEPHSISS
jgi:two-component system, NarL family, nitrate/nitrite response regulator NarL